MISAPVSRRNGHLLALAFEGGAGGEDLLGEVLGGAGTRVRRGRRRGRSQALAAAVAKFLARRIRVAAAGARHVAGQACAALAAEAGTVGILVVAVGALHLMRLAETAPIAAAADGATPRPSAWSRSGVSPLALGTCATM
jgi:hypothetical protein